MVITNRWVLDTYFNVFVTSKPILQAHEISSQYLALANVDTDTGAQ